MRNVVLFLWAWVFAVMVNAQSAATRKHEIQPGETLYSIARQYNVAVSVLQQLNPALDPDHIMAGQTINVPAEDAGKAQPVVRPAQQPATVTPAPAAGQQQAAGYRPQYKTKHEVQKKETVYSISRQYGVTEAQLIAANPHLKSGKLKKGAILNIPYTEEENRQYQAQVQQAAEEASKPKVVKYGTIKAAVILPFSRTEETMTPEAQKMANLYQGFLLAVDSLKLRGVSVDVYAFDETGTPVSTILQKPVMKEMQLIVGPARQYNLGPVANFAHENGIVHVAPLSNELSLVNEHPTTYQVNVSYSLVYSQVYNRFILLHKDDNIIFVTMNDRGDNPSYVAAFQKALGERSIAYGKADVADFAAVKELLKTNSHNVIIPSSGSAAAFDNLCKKLDALNLSSEYDVQLFGYPEWQTLSSKHEKHLNKYRCQFFASFFSNGGTARTQSFNARFRRWFRQDQYSSFPRYGELGYDIGAYFLKGLNDYGSAFSENLHSYSYHSLEFPFNFERKNSWSGYQNKSVLIVTRRTDGSVVVR